RQLNAVGITGVRDMGIWPEQIKAYQRLWREDKLTLRVNMVLGLPTRFLHGDGVVEWIKNLSRVPVNAFGDHRLNYGGLKIDAGNPNFQGEKVRKVIMAANRFGWQLNIHHRGVKGTTQVVLDALRDANRERPIKGRRFTLEHNLELQDPEVYRFLSENDVIVSPNPLYDFYAYAPDKFGGRANTPWESFEKASGEIIPEQYPFRDYESAQLTVTLGSDYPAVNYDREHPFVGFYVAVSKQTLGGQVGSLEQRASRQAALKYFTLNAAYATFEEDVRGSIEVNKLADMVVLSDDLMTVKVEDIKSIVVLRTIMGGKTVYQRQDEIVN
ncbi:MAG: putative amidohydrolase YtcJ, partial [Gammaproteobacteria bacterium]